MKVMIVGGVAGGASCAARLRRLDEKAEILMVERGSYVSYANCGLPYHVGGVIEKEESLLVANDQFFRAVFAVDEQTSDQMQTMVRYLVLADLRMGDAAIGTCAEVLTLSPDKLDFHRERSGA